MKNIHLIPTDKPSRFSLNSSGKYHLTKQLYTNSPNFIAKHICITSNEKPKAGDWSIYQNKIHKCIEDIIGDEFKKIILTSDQDLIKEGVQAIDDEFLEWFVNNPSCEEVEVDRIELNTDYRSDWKQKFRHKIIIPKEKQKQQLIDMMKGDEELGLYDNNTAIGMHTLTDTTTGCNSSRFGKQEIIDEASVRSWFNDKFKDNLWREGFKAGEEWQAERMYSEEDIDKQIQDFKHDLLESTSDSIKQLCSGAILGLNRLKQFKKK